MAVDVMQPVAPRSITTPRLVLRPTSIDDADRAFEIRSDWEVARMLSMASFPADREGLRTWFAGHQREWLEGRAYRFALDREERMIGVIDIDGVSQASGKLGYWLERDAWGQGYASEAAQALIRFGFEALGLTSLAAGHAADNPASGRVLTKLGFRPEGVVTLLSRPRGEEITQLRYRLDAP